MTHTSVTEVRTAVLELFREKLKVEVATDTDDLLHTGRLDSLGLVELLFLLEERFGIQVDLDRLDLDQLRTIESICLMVEQHRALSNGDSGC